LVKIYKQAIALKPRKLSSYSKKIIKLIKEAKIKVQASISSVEPSQSNRQGSAMKTTTSDGLS